nr:disulfide bond formation protein DsbB [Shewanella sp. Isolate11]
MLTSFAQSRKAWIVLFISALGLELSALFFQYVMKLDPCVMCIYIRVAVLGIMLAGLVGIIGCQYRLVRLIGVTVWAVSAGWGFKLAQELVEIQTNSNPFSTCSFLPEFPSWMPLHEWLPSIFMPTGMCTDTPWQALGITMAQWMIVGFSVYLIALVIFIVPALKANHKAK